MRAEQSWGPGKLDSSEILRRRRILEIQREEAMRSLHRLGDETRSLDSNYPKDIGDLGETTLPRESLFQQSGERRVMLRMIEAALARIEQGTYGVCAACGGDINPRRLDALPWTQYCLRCQQSQEQGREPGHSSAGANQRINLRKAG